MKKCPVVSLALLFTTILFWDTTVHATEFIMRFSVTIFQNDGPGGAVPTDPVTGTITYEAAGINDPIQSFDSINMTINGHSYTTPEIGFYQYDTPDDWYMISGLTGGIGALYSGTDDFLIRWYSDSLTPLDFIYTSDGVDGAFISAVYFNPASFTSFTIDAVPDETKTILLLGISMIGLAIWQKVLKKQMA
jgi:hypothetical protein